jgi:CubicO group peptidase (beta-lactamase class C family)
MGYVIIARAETRSMFNRIRGPGIDLVFRLSYLIILVALVLGQTIYFIYDLPLWVIRVLRPILEWGAPGAFLASIVFSLYAHARGRSVQRERITAPRGFATFMTWIMFFLAPLWVGSVSSAGGLKEAADTSGRALTPIDRTVFNDIREFARSRRVIGGVAAIITAEGIAYLKYGEFLQGSDLPPDENSVFQLASVSKVFTSLALARAVEEDRLVLTASASDYLSEPLQSLKPLLSGITLEQLATHTSGLPDATSLDRFWLRFALTPLNFYADLTENSLALGMGKMPTQKTPQPYEYSNLGLGLLGHVLCQSEGKDYELGQCYQDIVARDILNPLGMADTSITLSGRDAVSVVGAYGPVGTPVPHWTMASLHGAGGLNGTAKDLSAFLEAHLTGRADMLGRAMVLATSQKLADDAQNGNRGFAGGLGWNIDLHQDEDRANARPVFFHGGATFGNSSFIGFDPVRKVGLVILFNTATPGLERLGRTILNNKTIVP